jgi:NAD(P)-dependent dehydrogenase (short-subunit alcohol dehydrogenase family)
VYSATKWALTGFSEASRARLGHLGVRVVCVQPGPVPTPGWPHERLRAMPVLGRLLTADVDEIARTCVRAAAGRGSVAPVRPRVYATIPLLRGVAPWLVRGLLARAALRRFRLTGSRTIRQENTP